MTTEDYIEWYKRIIPVREYRYKDIIPQIFDSIKNVEVFGQQYTTAAVLNVISSTSIFSEVVSTTPGPAIIWDTCQWEITEKFLIAGLVHKNGNEDASMNTFKETIYFALSLRLTTVAPELSYVFAKKYRDILDADPNRFVAVLSEYMFTDLLYCEIISLGHEVAHIVFSSEPHGKALYKLFEDDFFAIMHGVLKNDLASKKCGNNKTVRELIFLIKQKRNKEYLKEIIIDSFAFKMLAGMLWAIERQISDNRSKGEMLDDVLALFNFIIRTLNSLNYHIEFWTRLGSMGATHRCLKPEYMHSNMPNMLMWNEQYWAREELTSLYTRVVFLRDENLSIETHNKRYLAMYNSLSSLTNKLLTFTDVELAEIMVEGDKLLRMNINSNELIEARNELFGI